MSRVIRNLVTPVLGDMRPYSPWSQGISHLWSATITMLSSLMKPPWDVTNTLLTGLSSLFTILSPKSLRNALTLSLNCWPVSPPEGPHSISWLLFRVLRMSVILLAASPSNSPKHLSRRTGQVSILSAERLGLASAMTWPVFRALIRSEEIARLKSVLARYLAAHSACLTPRSERAVSR